MPRPVPRRRISVWPDASEWNFGQIPADELEAAFAYEKARARQAPTGLTLECIKSRWPFYPAPWLRLTRNQKATAVELHTRREPTLDRQVPAFAEVIGEAPLGRHRIGAFSVVGDGLELSHANDDAVDLNTPGEMFSPGEIGVFRVAIELNRNPGEIVADFKRWLPRVLAEQATSRNRIADRFRYLAVLVTSRALAGSLEFKATDALHAKWQAAVIQSPTAEAYFGKPGHSQFDTRQIWARAIAEALASLNS